MDRRTRIMEVARRDGRVMVDDLAAEFGVSAHTIRRDINALCETAQLRRLHGGAEVIEGKANIPYATRAVLNFEGKTQIARATAALIDDDSTIFLSIGTTPALVATALAGKNGLTVITNNLNAAMALSENASNRIILPGGELRLPDRDFLGEAAVTLFEAYRADFGIYGRRRHRSGRQPAGFPRTRGASARADPPQLPHIGPGRRPVQIRPARRSGRRPPG